MKRKIALLLALVMMLSMAVPAFAEGAELDPEATVEPTAESTPEPTAEPTPEPDPEPTVEPTAEPDPEPTVEPTAEPDPEPTAEPTAAPVEQAPEATVVPADEATPEPTVEPTVEPTAEPEENEYGIVTLSDYSPFKGQVDISVTKALDIDWTPAFTASLSGVSSTVQLSTDGTVGSFKNLPANTYTLTISGRGFATYTQSITVGESDGMKLELTVGYVRGYDAAHPGVLQIGDVDGDGDVDSADRLMMMQAVAGESSQGFTDLNGDGVTDLADAEYLAKGEDVAALDESVKIATEAHFVPADAVKLEAVDNVEVSGVENLFSDNGGTFQMTAEEEITPEAPVNVSFDLADNAQADVILLDETNITSGKVIIEYADGTFGEGYIGDPVEPAALVLASDALVLPVPVEEMADANEAEPTSEPTPEPTVEPTQEPVIEEEPVEELAEAMAIDEEPVPFAEMPVRKVDVSLDANGNIKVDLAGAKAVKKVTLTITGTKSNNLAEISQVEFVNGMEDRIGPPDTKGPESASAVPGSREFTVTWTPCVNVTGYEVLVSDGQTTETYPLSGTSLTVTRFNKDEVLNYTTYYIDVYSVNGTWRSDTCASASVTPKPSGRPDKPDNVTASGGYESITVSWKNMKDTTSYKLYYKEQGADQFTEIPDLAVTKYTITGLNSTKATTYEVYVVGVNEIGQSEPSMHASAATLAMDPAEMPRYKLINRDASGRPGRDHIQSAAMGSSGGVMVNSDQDSGTSAWGTVDGNGMSYYDRATWDDGGYNNLSNGVGLFYEFDQPYKLDTIGMMSVVDGMDYTYLKIRWWDSAGTEHYIDRDDMRSERRTDASGRTYFFLRLPEPVEAKRIQIGAARYWAGNNRISVSEVYFYHYDSLKDDIMALYDDDLHTTLRSDVTEEMLNALRARIDETDEFGNEHPDKAQLLTEWETAMKIYKDQFLGRVIKVHDGITASGDEHGFGGLNAWQPLGVTAAAGETVTIYVGHSSLKTGSKTSLQLIITQYHAEASAMSATVREPLKVGANEITLPKVWKTTGIESGGALYVQYNGGAGTGDSYAVRVSGGVQVPVLDLYKVTDPAERQARTAEYLTALQTYAADIERVHGEKHQGEGSVSSEVDYAYEERNCILGATDIMLDIMMLSLPAKQVVSGCGGSAQTLLGSLDAMENMMYLFYQHKGLNANAPDAADRIPNRHLNIRYQRMFSGAFMYASGDHIGIEWPETAGMAGCGGVQIVGDGLYGSGNYFGWGIAHEIGHDINQGCYAIAEVTNNYFAVLAQARDTNDSVRFEYPKVYEKVTSGAKGAASNVFTQLGMYWQLHLAYDKGYNFKTYADYDQQLANLFWARVDTYARTPSKAPAPGGVALTIKGADIDQTLMRLACAAAQRDILDFFERWGKTPDADTIAYASQFDKETRAIYYVCDDSRRYTIEQGGASKLSADGSTAAIASVTAAADPNAANQVNITVASNGTVGDGEILGYEIVRCTISGGDVERQTVGFTTSNTFTDTVYAMNNRAVYYEVTLVDQYLNRSAVAASAMVKIRHEGDLAKTNWTITTTALTVDPADIGSTGGDEDMPEVVPEDVTERMADGKVETVYKAAVGAGAAITVSFNETQVITGFRYAAGNGTPIGGYTLEVRQGGQWVKAAEGTLGGDATVYFANAGGDYVSTYEADAMRLSLTGQVGETVSVAELTALGVTGDNVDFRMLGDAPAIGYLSEPFVYGDKAEDVIPAGSLVFAGSYKGNAAYNTVLLFDENGNNVGGTDAAGNLKAYQVILAQLPDTGNIQDVKDGSWIYWLEPSELEGFVMPKRVRAELYRVNNAQTNEGQRLVSDSLFVEVPATPGNIKLGGNAVG